MIRNAAGLGLAPKQADLDHYEQIHVHCDVRVAGGGVSGLAAALVAGHGGKRVIICDENPRFGGAADICDELVDGKPLLEWVV